MATNSQQKVGVLQFVFFLNLAVALAKVAVGALTGLLNLVADGIHSLGDSVSNIIGIVGIRLGDRPADDKYPYGYSKFETVATIVVSAMLLVAAIEILEAAWRRAFAPVVPTIDRKSTRLNSSHSSIS